MSSKAHVDSIFESLDNLQVEGGVLLPKVKCAYDYLYLFKTKEQISKLFERIVRVLEKTPISYKDDVNHTIRKYCFQIIKKMTLKSYIADENIGSVLNLLFSCFISENELNGVIIVQILSQFTRYYSKVSEDIADRFIQKVETKYKNFFRSAEIFLTSSSLPSDTGNLSQSLANCFTNMPLSSTLSTDSSSGLPLVSTGPQESSQSRHRSLSVDYINQPSSVVKRSSITNTSITSIDDSILVLDKVLFIVIHLFNTFRTFVPRYRNTLLESLSTIVKSPVFEPSNSTSKQYIQYIRVLCYSLSYFIIIIKSYNEGMEYLELIAKTVLQILTYFPSEFLSSSDIILQVLEKLLDRSFDIKTLRDSIPLLTGSVLFPIEVYSSDNSVFAEHRLQIIQTIVSHNIKTLTIQDILCVVNLYSVFISNNAISYRYLTYIIPQFKSFLEILKISPMSPLPLITSIIYRMMATLVRKLEDLQFVVENEARTRAVKKACRESDASNARFSAFTKGELYTHPVAEHDEYGIRISSVVRYVEIGDVVITESRYNIIMLSQSIASALNAIIIFITHFSPDSTNNQSRSILQLISLDRIIDYLHRYLVSVCHCGIIFQVDETRTKSQIEGYISRFAEVIISLPDEIARQVLSLSIETVYDTIKKYPLFMEFFYFLIHNQKSFKYTSTIFIDLICRHLSELDVDSSEPPVLFKLFRIFCTQLSIASQEEGVLKPYLRRLITECFRCLIRSKNWSYYLDFLYGCLSIFQHSQLLELSSELNTIIKYLIPQLAHILQVNYSPLIRERILEIGYRIPSQKQHIPWFYNYMFSFYVKGLAGPDSVQKSVISALEGIITQFNSEEVVGLLQADNIRPTLMSSLQLIIHNSSNQSLAQSAVSLLGRMGGKTRSSLKDRIDLPCYTDTDKHYIIALSNGRTINLDIYLESLLFFLHRNLIFSFDSKTDSKLCVTIRCSSKNIDAMRALRVQFKKRAISAVNQLLLGFCSNEYCLFDPSVYYTIEPSLIKNEKVNMMGIEDRCSSLLVYSLLLGCCDCEVKEQSKEALSSFLHYLACIIVQYAVPNTEGISFWPSSDYSIQTVVNKELFGPSFIPLPFILSIPAGSISPLLVAHALIHLLEREDSFYSDVAVFTLQTLHKSLHEVCNACESKAETMNPDLLMMIFNEYLLSIFFKECINGGWRLKMNMMPVLLEWCKQAPPLFIRRYSSLFIHYVFDVNDCIPHEYAMNIKQQSKELLSYVYLTAFQIHLYNTKVELSSDVTVPSISADEDHLIPDRIADSIKVILDHLFAVYGLCQQLACDLVYDLANNSEAYNYSPLMINELKERHEFEKVDRFSAVKQISIFRTMEMGLRLKVFTINQRVTRLVVQEAMKNVTSNISEYIKKCSEEDNPLVDELPASSFHFSYSLEFQLFISILRLLCMYLQLFHHCPNDDGANKDTESLCNSIAKCILIGCGCSNACIPSIVNGVLPFISLYLKPLSNTPLDGKHRDEYITNLTKELGQTSESSFFELYQIERLAPFLAQSHELVSTIFRCLKSIKELLGSTHSIKDNVLEMVIRLFSILGNVHIQPNDFLELFTLCPSLISAFSLYCISFGSVEMIYKPLAKIIINSKEAFVNFLLSYSPQMNGVDYPNILLNGVFTSVFAIISNEHYQEFVTVLTNSWDQFQAALSSARDKVAAYYILKIFLVSLQARDITLLLKDEVLQFLFQLWVRFSSVIEDYARREQVAVNTFRHTPNTVYKPLFYDDGDLMLLEILTQIFIRIMKSRFDPMISNQLSFVFCHECQLSFQELSDYYQKDLPMMLTVDQRKGVLSSFVELLRNQQLPDNKKECVIIHSVIPLVSTTCNNPSIDNTAVFTSSFFDSYIGYLVSINRNGEEPSVGSGLLVAILQLNTLLIKHLFSIMTPYITALSSFSWNLYSSNDSCVVAYALLFLCQFLNLKSNQDGVTRLFINIIHLYNNPHSSIIYRASNLLEKPIMELDEDHRAKLCSVVLTNMQMNEHILEEQIHIWRLIIQHAEFFYENGDSIFYTVLSNGKTLSYRSFNHRELRVDVISLVASFYARKQADNPDVDDPNLLSINTHMVSVIARVLLYITYSIQESLLFQRGCDLLTGLLALRPHKPLRLEDFDKQSSLNIPDNGVKLKDDQIYPLVMSIIVSFKITVKSLPHFHNEFVEINKEYLQKKIACVMEYIDKAYVFCSLIELLPELFALKGPYSPSISILFSSIKDNIITIFEKDSDQISPKTCKKATRVWRVLYLIKVIVEKNPASLPLFLSDLLNCLKKLLRLFDSISKDPNGQRFIYNQEVDSSCLTPNITEKLSLPKMPVLVGCEVIYSLLLIIELLSDNIKSLDPNNRNTFIDYICVFFKSVQRIELFTSVLVMIRKWLEDEDEVVTLQEITKIIEKTNDIRTVPENILYVSIISEYWNFIYAVCVRFSKSLHQDSPMNDQLKLSVIAGMIVTSPDIRKKFRTLLLPSLPSTLFDRLNYIFSETRCYADKKAWLPLFVEVLLRSDELNVSFRLSEEVERFPQVIVKACKECSDKVNPSVNRLIHYTNHSSQMTLMPLIDDLIELAYADMHFAYALWIQLFPLAWSVLTKEQQSILTTSLSRFLSSDLHFTQYNTTAFRAWEDFDRNYKLWGSNAPLPYVTQAGSRYTNSPVTMGLHALLEGVIRCYPQPRLSPTLLLHLADDYGCGPQVSLLLEKGLEECANEKEKSTYMASLKKTYMILNEDDAFASTIRSLPVAELRNGMTLERYNKIQTAQVAYLEGLRNQSVINSSELLLTLQERWKECAANLRQWKLLFEYGKLNHDLYILLECYGKSDIWNSYPRLFSNSPLIVEKDLMRPRPVLLIDRYRIIQSFSEGERYHTSLNELLLFCYRKLPLQPINAYDTLLHYIHQASDINNSCLLLSCNPTHGVGDDANQYLKLLNSYLMNNWDPLSKSEDLLIWKYIVYSHFIHNIPSDKANYSSTQFYQLRLSRCARYLDLPEISVDYLTSITYEPTSIYDFLDRWRERVIVAIELGCDTSIFNEIDRYQLDSLKDAQKATIQYVKGLYYMKDPTKLDEAISCFSHAVSDAKNIKAWDCWGKICYDRWKERGEVNDAKHCLHCCINQLRGNGEIFQAMSRFFHIVFYSFDSNMITQVVTTILQNNIKGINSSVWIPFLPFLFSRPTELQMVVFHSVITDLIRKYPFAVFYPLSTLCQSLGMPSTSVYAKPTTLFNGTISCPSRFSKQVDVAPLVNVSNYYYTLLCRSTSVPSQLLLLNETLHSIPHDPYRELLGSLDRILRTVYSEIFINGPNALHMPVSQDLKSRLLSLCFITFNVDNMVPSTFSFIQKHSASFLCDFAETISVNGGSSPNPSFPQTLEVLLERLLLWKDYVKECIQSKENDVIYQEFFSHNRCLPGGIEIPGQRMSVSYTSQGSATLQSLRSHIPVLYKEQHQWRHVDMIDEQGRTFRFYLEQVNTTDLWIEERTLYFQLFFDLISVSSHAIQMRRMHSSLPAYVNIAPSLRLVSFQPYSVTLEGVIHNYLGDEFDEKQLEYSTKLFILNHPQWEVPSEMAEWSKDLSKQNLFSSIAPSDLLTRYVFSHLASAGDFYAFRSEFVKQYASCQFMQRLFVSPNTHPDKIAFNLQTGNVTAYNIHANYIPSDRGYAIVDRMAVPFRLTPNITNFLSIYYEGAFELAIGADALTMKRENNAFLGYMMVFERENIRLLLKPKNMSDREVKEAINTNVNMILSRGKKYAPNVDVKLVDMKEDVDKEIREAVRISKDIHYLTQASPSFCAWF